MKRFQSGTILGVALLLAGSGQVFGSPLFSIADITIDAANTSPVIGGFPIENLFGAHVATLEPGAFDTIFTDSGPKYRNVYFHRNDLNPVTLVGFIVNGAQDAPTNPSRSFDYVALYTYTNVSDLSTYTLLYNSGPVTPDTNGREHVDANLNLPGPVGPYFALHFGARDGDPSVQFPGPRIYDVMGFDTAVPEPVTFVPLALLALGAAGYGAWKRRTATA